MRQHAHNPVFWYPWGEEAFVRAKAEDKPILLSIGYSTCYWCHVMEREVFENPSIAALMNTHFICIKVDREELPEIDSIYMMARQVLTQEGGWPNNVFLTPDLKPFFAGGTYGAKEAFGKPPFPRLIEWLAYQWAKEREEVLQRADKIQEIVSNLLTARQQDNQLDASTEALTLKLFQVLNSRFDEKYGGFFKQPKFPHENYLLYLLEYYAKTREDRALFVATESMFDMAAGGIYDHVGCGFHRYAIDRQWWVPHFEKMLYNQALCARAYTELHRLTGNPYAASIARGTLDAAAVTFRHPKGGFYTAIDAEQDGVEGAYYVWNAEQLREILSEEEQAFFTRYYALAELPVMHGHEQPDGQVVIANQSLWLAAYDEKQPFVFLEGMSGQVMNKLLSVRNKRTPPRMDDKILTGLNGLMIDAYARASAVFNQPAYLEIAQKAADYILLHAVSATGELYRLVAKNIAQFDATLEDYAYFIHGLLMLYRVDKNQRWLNAALSLLGQAEGGLRDPSGGYYFTQARTDVLVRSNTVDDSAIPSPNGIMLHNFIDLYELTENEKWLKAARQMQAAFLPTLDSGALPEYCTYLQAVLRLEAVASYAPAPSISTAVEPVSMEASYSKTDDDEYSLEVSITLADGWYIYAPDAPAPLLATKINVFGPGAEKVSELTYPEPHAAVEMQGVDALVYTRSITTSCNVTLAESTAHHQPLYVTLTCQPCTQNACAAPVNLLVVAKPAI